MSLTVNQSFTFSLPGLNGTVSAHATLPLTTTAAFSINATYIIVQSTSPWTASSVSRGCGHTCSSTSGIAMCIPLSTNGTHTTCTDSSLTSVSNSTATSASSNTTSSTSNSTSASTTPSKRTSGTSGTSSSIAAVSASRASASFPSTSTSKATSTVAYQSDISTHHSHSDAIAGGVIGGLVGLLALLGLLLWYRRWRRRPKVAPSAEFMAMAAAMREDRTPTPDSTLARDSMEPAELLPRTGPGSYNTDPLLEKLREAVAQIPHIRGPNGDSGGSMNEKADDVFMAI